MVDVNLCVLEFVKENVEINKIMNMYIYESLVYDSVIVNDY